MRSVLITAGSTREYIDPVRYISSGSSGKQGYAIAECMGLMGWDVKLVSCPVSITPNHNLYEVLQVETSAQLLETCLDLLPVDVAICTAAVTDWVPYRHPSKLKKRSVDAVSLMHSPDIVRCISISKKRPKLVIGFCLESENLIESAKEKLAYKGCDWVVANHQYVAEEEQTMGSDRNKISIVTRDVVQHYPVMTKQEVANLLAKNIVDYFNELHIS
ncbi:phosphopantothenoylcysteine synthase/decarboxylase (dfp) [Anaplasma marginale str. Dawn]|uniref:Phosphopantothenoylcysteine synthase/decarboxylase (Dfp) n=1 Tax=Anaplasma marginale (strain Florida) TaxID=320483 RepID=B9KJ92_ANAMF|nr:phosphopantothenoylcysteine decarboxylase [Anaplasma marginale]ACM49554.1 phosphopantothenoylcysteine synthase/decarboxylase (dfp) [Anaplasma marginale str. Florida]AGZ79049.1 phosphopantothenoylcysteine synthase/decarboxylase (dfp) [Anaplasma marginale str. Gypsy Plains]AGZ79859.1 phosphopantothenoylcysteine synthase/decarboxylase (dfp) [Anaplasma marginale str. Dawn]AXW84258.1 DNA / pantothenate metabolism flavoprotein family protein [Anaplasma marginale]KAB0451876.1 phosphopantothenoylcy